MNSIILISDEENTSGGDSAVTAAPKSGKLVGNTFFGPDFSVEQFKGIE